MIRNSRPKMVVPASQRWCESDTIPLGWMGLWATCWNELRSK